LRVFSVEIGFLEVELEGLGLVVFVVVTAVGCASFEEIEELPFLFLLVVPFGVEDLLCVCVGFVLSFFSGTNG
jgi:hypothetical protein